MKLTWQRNPNGTHSLVPERGRAVVRIVKERRGWCWFREDVSRWTPALTRDFSGRASTLKVAKRQAEGAPRSISEEPTP
jgi:hypothetical protein